jgi:hypothetical protein
VPTIKLLRRAELELIEACEWYEKRQKGLSARLRKEVREAFNFINLNPELYPKQYETDLHFCTLKKFPFIVVY